MGTNKPKGRKGAVRKSIAAQGGQDGRPRKSTAEATRLQLVKSEQSASVA